MRILKELMFTFSAITTCTVIGAAVFISIFWKNSELSSAILWQIIIYAHWAICCFAKNAKAGGCTMASFSCIICISMPLCY